MKRGVHTRTHNSGLGLDIFTEADLDDIHLASLEILQRAGVLVEADDACDIYADAGCKVDRESHIVKIPPHLVADALSSVPPSFRLCGRDPEDDVVIEPGRVTFCPFGEGLMMNDLETGENRPATKQDVADQVLLADAMSEIEVNMAAITAQDCPAESAGQHALEAALENTTKPICATMLGTRNVEDGFKMAAAVVGGMDAFDERPIVFFPACPVAPMVMPKVLTENAIAHARHNVPFVTISMGMAGSATPITLASTLVVQNVEQLATLVLTQLAGRGVGFMMGTSTCTMDMRYGNSVVGTPETALYQAGTAAIARYYNVPSWTAGY
jgi:trimethylamine---corrinoid protein Co-methyltransferase